MHNTYITQKQKCRHIQTQKVWPEARYKKEPQSRNTTKHDSKEMAKERVDLSEGLNP